MLFEFSLIKEVNNVTLNNPIFVSQPAIIGGD
jgi:hypothetical protein